MLDSTGHNQPKNRINLMQPGYLIDMDGVIYRENQLIPGAARFIQLLRERSIPFLFLTNNSAPTPHDLSVKLRHLGIPDLTARHFYTAALNTADFLAEIHPTCTVFTVGDAGLSAALLEKGIANDSIAPTYVVIGEGGPSMERIDKAHRLIERGARLIATNPDNWCPVSHEDTRPGAGAIARFLETSTGARAYFLGKPNPYMFQQARRRLGRQADPVIMIGDTMETDIRGAVEVGLQGYLTLTGSTRLEDIGRFVYQPTRILNSVEDLVVELETGQTSDRLNSPAFGHAAGNEGPARNRHQPPPEERYRRPRPAMT
jgi:NagD protein